MSKKRKIIIISISVFLALVIIVAAVLFNIYKKYYVRKTGEKYKGYSVTSGETVNEKMKDMKNSIDGGVPFEPEISHTIEPSEIKLTPNSTKAAEENSRILERVIKKAKSGTKIVLPEGDFYLGAPINISKKSNITVSAERSGALLINTAYTPFGENNPEKSPNVFNVFACENLKIENLSFDYQSQVTAEGVIVDTSPLYTYFRLYDEYSNGTKSPLRGGEAVTSVFTAKDGGFTEENWPENPVELQKQDDEIFYIPLKIGAVGDKIACRFKSSGPYVSYVINATNTDGLILQNLRCFSCPGGFLLATSGNANLYCKQLTVGVQEGSERLLGSNEDCLHLRDISGTLTVIDSTFWGIGDDALNIHSGLYRVSKIDGNSLTASAENAPLYYFAKKGETVELFDNGYNSLGTADIKKVKNGKITFANPPKSIKSAAFIQNVSLLPDTVVSNCEIGFARARGLLIQSKNCVVENCKFKNIRLAAILAAPDFEYWLEGGFCDNLLIENNTFHNCASLQNGMGVIHVTTGHDGIVGSDACAKGHKNVTVLNNRFEDCKGETIKAYNVQNLKNQ